MTIDGKDERDPEKPGRRDTDTLGKELDNHISRTEKELSSWIKRGLIAFAVIGLACTVALFGFGIVLSEQKETADQLKIVVEQNENVVKQNEKTAHDIQEQRAESVQNDCESTNKRNQDTSNQLIALAKEDEDNQKTEAGKQEVRRRRDVTLALIDLLQPVQDCAYLVAVTLGQISPTPVPSPVPTP